MKEKETLYIFSDFATNENNPKWIHSVTRQAPLSHKPYDIRSDFDRDCTRILHCSAYRRLKHKTQVFFATNNDHVCTRIEHVNHVASISKTIAKALGLNVSLVEAIALGHDLGHSPFGHHGETIIAKIMEKEGFEKKFWHEKNSLRFIDYIDTLPNYCGFKENLNLTYATRDGIVCHCGEVNENFIKPRDEYIDLNLIEKGKQMPYTYEGCVVKVSDKIAVIESLLDKVDTLIIGGGMAFTFLKALGHKIGKSICELDKLDLAHEILEKAKKKGIEIVLPVDTHVSTEYSNDAEDKFVHSQEIPDEWEGLDIGPETIKKFGEIVKDAKTVIWNGPLGVCEFSKFKVGTEEIAKILSGLEATTIIG